MNLIPLAVSTRMAGKSFFRFKWTPPVTIQFWPDYGNRVDRCLLAHSDDLD